MQHYNDLDIHVRIYIHTSDHCEMKAIELNFSGNQLFQQSCIVIPAIFCASYLCLKEPLDSSGSKRSS